MDYKNDEILREECEFGRRMGFLGKQAVHPRQLEIIQRCFLPTDHGKLQPAVYITALMYNIVLRDPYVFDFPFLT